MAAEVGQEAFGAPMRKYFAFEKGWCNLNQGSFGTTPGPVLERVKVFHARAEARPDSFLRYEGVKLLNDSRALVASQFNVPVSTIVMLPNATTGINVVFRNLKYEASDTIIYFSTSYGACQNIILATQEYSGCNGHRIELAYPLTDDMLMEKVDAAIDSILKAGAKPKAMLLDTFVSLPGVRMPFERLLDICRKHGVLSVMDGAHGYGNIELDLAKLDPDFFVSNCHKWGFVPRPCAMFYVPVRNQKLIRTSFPTSHYFEPDQSLSGPRGINPLPPPSGDDTPFTKMFEFVGTSDSTSYYCVPAAYKFRRHFCGGDDMIQTYCRKLAAKGGALVANKLGTQVMDNAEGTLSKQNSMVNVRLPLDPDTISMGDGGPMTVVQWGQKQTLEFNTFIPFFWHAEAWWVRLSAQIYLELSDFQFAAGVLDYICTMIRAGKHIS